MPIVTIYRGARDTAPVDVADLPWPEVARALAATANEPPGAPADASAEEQKKSLIAFAPHALAPGATRALENVTQVSALVLDVDQGATPEEIAQRLTDFGIAGLVYESPTSTPSTPKFRVVAPVVAPISPADCRETRLRFAAVLGLAPDCGVRGAVDASKLFFAGRLHGTPERRVWLVDGAPVDTSALPPCPGAEWHAPPPAPALAAHLSELPPANAGVAAALGPWTAHQGRKWLVCGAVGGIMRKYGYTAAQCESTIRAWLPADEPTVDADAGVSWALGAWSKAAEDVSGRAELERVIGSDHADVVCEAARAGTPWGRVEVATRGPFLPVPTNPSGDPLGVRHLYSDPEVAIDYLCAGLCLAPCTGKISIIGGLPNAGKGPLADYIAVCFATGTPLFGRFKVEREAVLLIDYEGALLTMRRTRRMARALGIDPNALDATLDVRDTTAVHPFDPAFLAAVAKHPARVVVLDSYTSALLVTDLDPNKNEFAQFARALAKMGKLVIAVAHARKPAAGAKGERPTLGDIAGSGALGAMAFTGISCWKPDDEDPYRVRVGCMRAPEKGFEMFDIVFRDVEGDGLALEFQGAEAIKAIDAAKDADEQTQRAQRVLAWLRARPNWHKADSDFAVVDVKGETISTPKLTGVLTMLVDAGLVSEDRASGKTRYHIKDPNDKRSIRVEAGKVLFA